VWDLKKSSKLAWVFEFGLLASMVARISFPF
jgi:hypothetical protein